MVVSYAVYLCIGCAGLSPAIREYRLPEPEFLGPIVATGTGIVWIANLSYGSSQITIRKVGEGGAVSSISSIGAKQITGLTVTKQGVPWFVAIGMSADTNPDSIGPSYVGYVNSRGSVRLYRLPAAVGFPSGIAWAGDDTFWITSLHPASLTEFSKNKVVKNYRFPISNCDPHSIVVDSAGNVWVAEWATRRIGEMSTRGTWRELALPDFASPFELAASDRTIWFTEEGARRIGRYSESTDKFTEYDLPSVDSAEARGIAVGFGDVWFTEPYADKVGRLRDGKITEYSASDQSLPSGIAIARQGQVWFTEPNGGTYGITTFGAVGGLSY